MLRLRKPALKFWTIEATIPAPRPELAPTAPKIDTIKIDVDKIKIVIGKGGETIDKIIAETGVKIDIDEEGNVSIYSSDQDDQSC